MRYRRIFVQILLVSNEDGGINKIDFNFQCDKYWTTSTQMKKRLAKKKRILIDEFGEKFIPLDLNEYN